jgi:hypothetical protein
MMVRMFLLDMIFLAKIYPHKVRAEDYMKVKVVVYYGK